MTKRIWQAQIFANLTEELNMKFTNRNTTGLAAIVCLSVSMAVVSTPAHAGIKETAFNATKKVLMALPVVTQQRIAHTMQDYPAYQLDATEWRLKLLVDDFKDTNNMRPLSYYVDEFIEIWDSNPDYFKELLFKHALKANTPDKDKVMDIIRTGLLKTKHSKNVDYIKLMLYMSIRKHIRKDGKIPTDGNSLEAREYKAALTYHASFNKG